ncbi:MAG: Uma2 family endonuclease [Polyangiaceae bacterium]|nr:Uma2 family endonuclease [Polyangiaceae bacterium]
MSEPAKRRAIWDDLLDVAEGYVGEIVDGELNVVPRPAPPHAETASDLGGVLTPPFRFGRGGPGGWVIVDEPRLAVLRDIRVPDLAGWKKERYVRPELGPYTVVPDWICEILSPSTAVSDRTEKLPLYARAGVPFVWLIDPVGFSLEVYELERDRYFLALTAQGRATLRVPPFAAIEIELELLWGDRLAEAEASDR